MATPGVVGEYMADLLPFGVRSVLEPTPGAGGLVCVLEGRGYSVLSPPGDFWDLIRWRADAVVMNPPFTPMVLGYDILFRCMEGSDLVVALMPWFCVINSRKRVDRLLGYGLKSVTHLPRTVFSGARVQCCVLELVRGFEGDAAFRVWCPGTGQLSLENAVHTGVSNGSLASG